jgi:hypothetical protein
MTYYGDQAFPALTDEQSARLQAYGSAQEVESRALLRCSAPFPVGAKEAEHTRMEVQPHLPQRPGVPPSSCPRRCRTRGRLPRRARPTLWLRRMPEGLRDAPADVRPSGGFRSEIPTRSGPRGAGLHRAEDENGHISRA